MTDFMIKKNYFFAISIIIVFAGIIGLLINGLNYDIQFQGGTIIQFEMSNDNFDANEIGAVLRDMLNKRLHLRNSRHIIPKTKMKKSMY